MPYDGKPCVHCWLIVGILATVTMDVVAGVLAVISRAAFSEIGHMRGVGWNLVVISAHDRYTV